MSQSRGSDGFYRFAALISAAVVQWRLSWGTAAPTASELPGSLYIRVNGASSALYQNTSTGPGAGTTWTNITGGGGSYTDEQAQDAVGGIVGNTSTVNLTYADATPAVTADVNDASITLAKMANIATDRLIGRDSASTGVPEALTVGGGVEFTGSGGIQRSALTGDVTASAGSNSTTIANDAVTNAKAANMAESTIKGRAAGAGTGDPTDLTATQAREVLGVESTVTVRVANNVGQHYAAYALDGTYSGRNVIIMAPADQGVLVTPDGGAAVEVNGSNAVFTVPPGQIAYLTPTGVSNRWYAAITGGEVTFTVALTPDQDTTVLTTGDNKALFKAPHAFRIKELIAECHPDYESSSGHVAIMVRRGGGDLLTNPVRIDVSEDSSLTASVAYSWAGDYYDCAQGDQFRIDCDAAGTGVRGVMLHIVGYPVAS